MARRVLLEVDSGLTVEEAGEEGVFRLGGTANGFQGLVWEGIVLGNANAAAGTVLGGLLGLPALL